MRLGTRAIVISLCSVSAVAAQTPAQTPQTPAPQVVFRGRLVGVFDEQTGEAIQGAEVRNMANGLSALTTVTGTLTLFFVDTAGGVVSIKKVGYEPQTIVVSNSPRDSTGMTIVLKRTGQTLPTVVTKAKSVDSVVRYLSPALRGFEERRHQGFGRFVSEAELRKREGARMSETLVAYVPGAIMAAGRGGARHLVGHRTSMAGGRALDPSNRTPCYVTVYFDGVLLYSKTSPGAPPPPDFAAMSVDEYAGVEFYAGGASLPMQYTKTDAGCGTLLLWTRER